MASLANSELGCPGVVGIVAFEHSFGRLMYEKQIVVTPTNVTIFVVQCMARVDCFRGLLDHVRYLAVTRLEDLV